MPEAFPLVHLPLSSDSFVCRETRCSSESLIENSFAIPYYRVTDSSVNWSGCAGPHGRNAKSTCFRDNLAYSISTSIHLAASLHQFSHALQYSLRSVLSIVDSTVNDSHAGSLWTRNPTLPLRSTIATATVCRSSHW